MVRGTAAGGWLGGGIATASVADDAAGGVLGGEDGGLGLEVDLDGCVHLAEDDAALALEFFQAGGVADAVLQGVGLVVVGRRETRGVGAEIGGEGFGEGEIGQGVGQLVLIDGIGKGVGAGADDGIGAQMADPTGARSRFKRDLSDTGRLRRRGVQIERRKPQLHHRLTAIWLELRPNAVKPSATHLQQPDLPQHRHVSRNRHPVPPDPLSHFEHHAPFVPLQRPKHPKSLRMAGGLQALAKGNLGTRGGRGGEHSGG